MHILKEKLNSHKNTLPDALVLRLHRAISWIELSEQEESLDQQFIALSIALACCYQLDATEDAKSFNQFAHKLSDCDSDRKIFELLWEKYSGPVKALIKNPYVYDLFWQAQRNKNIEWQGAFEQSSVAALNALSRQQLPELLTAVLERLFVLRSQIFYGGATFNSQLNRDQLEDSATLLAELLPVIVKIMLLNPETDWGLNAYPPINDEK